MRRGLVCTCIAAAWLAGGLPPAGADVVVVANRTARPLELSLYRAGLPPTRLSLAGGAVCSLPTEGRLEVEFDTGPQRRRYLLDANAAYFLGTVVSAGGAKTVDMQKIGLGGTVSTARGRRLAGELFAPGTLSVKILVDEEEPANRRSWEARLRQRVQRASDILQQHCHMRLEVIALDVWNSDNATTSFHDSLAEFEREVDGKPAQLAIGFTSQYQVPRGRTHLGGTRGPLHSHILLREWSQHVGEPERLELLVHELGHHLGAAHSPERDSVMRPILGDRKAIRAGFQVKFDPVNTLIMSLVVEEMRRENLRDFRKTTHGTRRRLRQIYGTLAKAYPQDGAAARYLRYLDVAHRSPLVTGTRQVLSELVRAAQENHSRPDRAARENRRQPQRLTEDPLTEWYVRRAAQAATRLGDDIAPQAFLYALGIGLDHSLVLTNNPKTGSFVRAVEPTERRTVRLGVLGKPTVHQRRDLAQHFAVSAYLTVVLGAETTEQIGISKELLDATGESGFSFADLAADKAGIALAKSVLGGHLPLKNLAESFTVEAYVPSLEGLPENISHADFSANYGNSTDARFEQLRQEINRRIIALPGYANVLTGPLEAP